MSDTSSDETQLLREYDEFCRLHSNPPSFETWKRRRSERPAPVSMSEYRRVVTQGLIVPRPERKA